jgi:uncharacterized protein (TIRG00374 family)
VKPRTGRAIRLLITAAIAVFLIIFARTIDWGSAWESIRSASLPMVAAALAVNFLSILVKAVRWWLFLRPAGSRSLPLAVRATVAGSGLNNVLVANGGDAARVVFVSRATGIPSSTILATLALERMFDPVGFVILLVYGVIVFRLPPSLDEWRFPAELLLAVIAVFLIWFVYTSRHARPGDVPEQQEHATTIWGKLKAYLSGFAVSTRMLATGPRFIGALVLSMIGWITQVLTFEYAAAAAHVSMPHAASLAALLATNLGLLVRATPGNVGFFQFVFALATAPFGIERNDAIAVSLLIQTLQIVPMTLLGVALAPEFIFKRSKARQKADALVAENEPAMSGSVLKESEELSRASRES